MPCKEAKWDRLYIPDPEGQIKRALNARHRWDPPRQVLPGRPWRTMPQTARERLRSEQNRKRPHIRVTLPRVTFLKGGDE